MGTIRDTGLPDGAVDAVVFIDVPSHAADWATALGEIYRVLAPGGRAVLARNVRKDSDAAWKEPVEAAGLAIEHIDERPDEPEIWRSLYRLWTARETDLRRELGDDQTDSMLTEANHVLPILDAHSALVATLRRPTHRFP